MKGGRCRGAETINENTSASGKPHVAEQSGISKRHIACFSWGASTPSESHSPINSFVARQQRAGVKNSAGNVPEPFASVVFSKSALAAQQNSGFSALALERSGARGRDLAREMHRYPLSWLELRSAGTARKWRMGARESARREARDS